MQTLGMPVLIELQSLQTNIDLCQKLGLAVLELSMNLPDYCPEALPDRTLRQVQRQSGLSFTLHLPEETDLATFHEPVREGHLARAIQAVRWAGESGIRLVNMHLNAGVYYTLPDGRVFVYERYFERYRGNLLRSMETLAAEAAVAGITLCVENTGHWALGFIQRPLQELLDGGLAFLTWDTGHDGAAGLADKPFVMKNMKHLQHIHLHDYAAGRDHLPLFTGQLDVAEALLAARGAGAAAIVEVKTAFALEESVKKLKNYNKL